VFSGGYILAALGAEHHMQYVGLNVGLLVCFGLVLLATIPAGVAGSAKQDGSGIAGRQPGNVSRNGPSADGVGPGQPLGPAS